MKIVDVSFPTEGMALTEVFERTRQIEQAATGAGAQERGAGWGGGQRDIDFDVPDELVGAVTQAISAVLPIAGLVEVYEAPVEIENEGDQVVH